MDILTAYNNTGGAVRLDYQVDAPGLAQDDGLQSAVVLSLFTDRRADEDDVLPDGSDRRGWWGDSVADQAGDQIGSRLWLLRREKASDQTLQRARQYAAEALRWMVDDGVVKRVDVAAEYQRPDGSGRTLALQTTLTRQDNSTVRYRFSNFWSSLNGA